MAVDQEVAQIVARLVELRAELDQRLDILALRRPASRPGADDVVEAQGEPMVRVVGGERARLRVVRDRGSKARA